MESQFGYNIQYMTHQNSKPYCHLIYEAHITSSSRFSSRKAIEMKSVRTPRIELLDEELNFAYQSMRIQAHADFDNLEARGKSFVALFRLPKPAPSSHKGF